MQETCLADAASRWLEALSLPDEAETPFAASPPPASAGDGRGEPGAKTAVKTVCAVIGFFFMFIGFGCLILGSGLMGERMTGRLLDEIFGWSEKSNEQRN